MSESDWLRADEPQAMLEWLRNTAKPSDRKRRLFVCACCRAVWALIDDRRTRKAVELAERQADAAGDEKDRRGVLAAAYAVTAPQGVEYAVAYLGARSLDDLDDWPDDADQAALESLAWHQTDLASRNQGGLLREIFGPLPFGPVTLEPTWRTPTVLALTRRAYDHRHLPQGTLDPALLSALADALGEAGCDNGEVLAHLRSPGLHFRGCWPVDAVLAKW